ncbi:hypothetical protein evm_011199 [Chilo suppressalis]|nr:hypothetical protein evm_011199 [Chilo suppressalis]
MPIFGQIVELAHLAEARSAWYSTVFQAESGYWQQALPSANIATLLDKSTLSQAISLRLGVKTNHPHRCRCGTRVGELGHLSCHACINDLIRKALVVANVPAVFELNGIFRDDGKRLDGMTLIGILGSRVCSKRRKYSALNENYIFVPFGVETMGPWGIKLKKRLTEVTGDQKAGGYLGQRISLAIQRGNAASLLGTIPDGGAGGESFLSDITRDLRSEISSVMEMANVTYSEPVINTTYKASVEFDMRAMGSLYNSTHLVIDFIANKQAYPEGIVSVSDGHVEVASPREHWRPLLSHYAGPTAVIVLAALLVVTLPLAGLFWCCCYWCKSGRRRRAFDRKYDACLKGILAILLIALLTLFMFGVVCAFATDSQLESSAGEAPAAVRVGLADAREFLHATQAHARHLLVINYRELEMKVNGLLSSSGVAVSAQVGALSRGAAVSALATLVARLDSVRDQLRHVARLTDSLRARADRLNAGLRKVKGQLLQTLAQCEQPPCVRLQEKYKIGQLDTEIQYNRMPDVSELLANVTLLLEGNIKEEVADGQRVFRDIQRGIQRSLDEHIPGVQAELARTGRQLSRVADDITAMAGNASQELKRREDVADAMQSFYERYGPYRRYLGLSAAAALLAVCITFDDLRGRVVCTPGFMAVAGSRGPGFESRWGQMFV